MAKARQVNMNNALIPETSPLVKKLFFQKAGPVTVQAVDVMRYLENGYISVLSRIRVTKRESSKSDAPLK